MRVQKAEIVHEIQKLQKKIKVLMVQMTPNLPSSRGVKVSERIKKLVSKGVLDSIFATGLSKSLETKVAQNFSAKRLDRALAWIQFFHDRLKAMSLSAHR